MESVILCFDVDCDPGFEAYREVIAENGNRGNQAADQRLIKFSEIGRLSLNVWQFRLNLTVGSILMKILSD